MLDASRLPLEANIAIFLASATMVWYAGTRLARCADAIAARTGIGREFLGLLLLGGVTSLPEMAVGVTSSLQGTPTLSVNDVLGSAAINIVILAIADAVVGPRALTSMQGSSGVLLQGVLGIVLMALVISAVIVGDTLVLGAGVWSWLLLAAYITSVRILAKSHAGGEWIAVHHKLLDTGQLSPDVRRDRPLSRIVQLTIAAGLVILVAGFLLARTGEALAEQTGLGTSFFGAVFLGFSTSLPEISTVIAAVRLKQYEMAISDVFGTNLFNVTIIVIVDLLYSGGPVLVEAGRFSAFAALLAIMFTAFYLAGMLERRDRTILRMGMDSAAVVIGYIIGVVVLHGLR